MILFDIKVLNISSSESPRGVQVCLDLETHDDLPLLESLDLFESIFLEKHIVCSLNAIGQVDHISILKFGCVQYTNIYHILFLVPWIWFTLYIIIVLIVDVGFVLYQLRSPFLTETSSICKELENSCFLSSCWN